MQLQITKNLWKFSMIVLSVVGYGFFVFAAAPTGGYVPGQTLDPACAPGDTDCQVQTGWIIDTANSVVYNTTNSIGIGTSAPAYTLEVMGDFGTQMTHTSGDISGINQSDSLFGLGVEGVGMTTIANNTEIYLDGILDFGVGKGSYLYYFDTNNNESASIAAINFNGNAPLVIGQSLNGSNQAAFYAVNADEGFYVAGPHDNTSQTPNTNTYAFRVLDRDINDGSVQTFFSVRNDGVVVLPMLLNCSSLYTDGGGALSCGSSGSSVIGMLSGATRSIATTGTDFTGSGTGFAGIDSIFFGEHAGDSAIGADNAVFLGYYAGYFASNSYSSNFIGNNAGTQANMASYSNFIGASAGASATSSAYSNFIGYSAGVNATGSTNANLFGTYAGSQSTDANYSNFIGYFAGGNTSAANRSNFLGLYAGFQAAHAEQSNFLGSNAGSNAVFADRSNFLGIESGINATYAAHSNFLGPQSGYEATNASYSNFIGSEAGRGAVDANNAIFIGYQSGLNDTVDNSIDVNDYSILLGPHTSTGGYSNSIALGSYATNTASNELMIGSSTRPIDTLVLTGSGGNTCILDVTVASPSCSSDEKLKTNVTDLSLGTLDKLMNVRTVSYTWKNYTNHGGQIGFLAQDLEQYFPQVVSDAPNGYKTVSYGGMTPILVQAVRELNIKIGNIQKVSDTVDPTFLQNLRNWFANSSNGITDFFAGSVHGRTGSFSDELCVGNTCVTQDQFLQLVHQNGGTTVVVSGGGTVSETTDGTSSGITSSGTGTSGSNDSGNGTTGGGLDSGLGDTGNNSTGTGTDTTFQSDSSGDQSNSDISGENGGSPVGVSDTGSNSNSESEGTGSPL